MLISLEGFLAPDETDPEVQFLTAFTQTLSEHGMTAGLESLLIHDPILKTEYLHALQVDVPATEAAAKASAATNAAATAAGEKSKGMVGKILEKLGNFLKYVSGKVTGFVSGMANRIAHTRPSTVAKAPPASAVNGAMDSLSATAKAVDGMSGVANDLANNPKSASTVMGKVSSIFASIKTNAYKVVPFKSGDKVSFKVQNAAAHYPKVPAKLGLWDRASLGGAVTKFSNGAHALWNALGTFLKAIKRCATAVLGFGGKVASKPIKLGDKASAGAITKLQSIAMGGGVKGIVAGIGSFMLISWLVNSVLKLIRSALNFASGMIHDTVDAICGPETDHSAATPSV